MASTPKHNLMALSSAAVIAVYAAGYTRTKAAAAKIAEREERRPPVRATTPRPAPSVRSTEKATQRGDTGRRLGEATQKGDTGRRLGEATQKGDTKRRLQAQLTVAPTSAASTVRAGSATSIDTGSSQPNPPTPAATTPAPPAAAAPVIDTTKRADSATVAWKDGYYFGWGTSRHGDIQAGVEIKDGRIVSALITQCLTRYSCSWIEALPGQVVSRQSAEVDFVSGATQSTNAFYYAVVEALGKAR